MISSGMKRGLAATAISAMAVTGLPLLAGSANAVTNVSQYGADEVQLLSQFSGAASIKNDGQNTTLRLEAGAGTDVSSVTFQYNTGNPSVWVDIATVSRNDDGAFSYEWNASALAGATVDLRAQSVNATTVDPDASDARPGIKIDGGGVATESVNLTDGTALGAFQAPYGGTNKVSTILSGTTSATAGTVDLFHFFGNPDGVAAGTADVKVADGATTGTFAGVADITGYDFTGSPDELTFGAQRGSDDVEAYTLYQQTISSVTAEPTSKTIPAGQKTTPVVVTVTDQNGAPIAGAEVRDNTGSALVGITNENGQVTANQGPGTTFYYANATDSDAYESGLGDKRTADVTVTQYNPAPTALAAKSQDGPAFDMDENDTTGAKGVYVAGNDITVQVKDQNGNDANADNQTLSYYWVATPFNGTAAVRYPDATAKPNTFTANETGTGQYNVAFPNDGVSGTYELFAGLSEVPIVGGGNIATSKVLTVKAGQASINYTEGSPETGPAGGQEVVDGALALEDGTGLSGRKIQLDLNYNSAANATDDANPDAQFLNDNGTLGGLSKTVTTGASGTFAATVKDQTDTPQLSEIGDNIDAMTVPATVDSDDPGATDTGHGVNFLVNTTPATIEISKQDAPLESAGEVETFTVTVMSGDQDPNTAGVQSVPLTNEPVALTTDHGYFTDGVPVVTSGGDQGVYDNDGQSKTVTTNDQGVATFKISIGRDTAFDDNGLVTSHMTATAGSVSDTQDQDWTSENPLNGGDVKVVFSPDSMQESSVLPKAPVSDTVYLDVVLTDQFGNTVGGETYTISDNTGLADVYADDADTNTPGIQVISDYAMDGDVQANASKAVDQAVTATWIAPTNQYTTPTAPATPQPAPAGTETLTGSKTINWYAVDYANSTFTLTHSGADTQPVGTTVTENYTAKDQFGEPISDLYVSFFRSGPDNLQDGDGNYNGFTGQDGTVQYVFQGAKAGTATITATGRDGGPAGDVVPAAEKTDKVSFGGQPPVNAPKIYPGITAEHIVNADTISGYDRITVRCPKAGADARVKLYRVKNGVAKRVKSKYIGADGVARFKRADLNGDKKNYYFAVVAATSSNQAGKTKTVGVK